jgi:soluble lytic murein transglycosylase
LKLKDEHIELSHAFVEKYPNSVFADEVLNNLASAYIIDDQDDEADKVFREILNRYPAGRFTERAAWKAGWWAYRQGQFTDALQYFDRGAAQFPRSDYRPSWLYWSARAAQQAGDIETGVTRLRLTATDYHNSYYGRLAVKRLEGERGGAVIAPTLQRQPLPSTAIPTAGRIAALLSVGLNREAMSELHYAQRVWGDSAQLQATIALTHTRLGNVRAGINAMKRAYPQYLAAGGETLPAEILKVIFPVDYWPLLQKYSKDRNLDPYVVAALVAQESNFDPVVRSHANAYGLMQVLPSTGRGYARRLGVKPFSAKRLTRRRSTCGSARRFLPTRSASSVACTSRWPPTTPATAACSSGSARNPACRRTNSSTTSHFRKRRITSSASSAPPRTTDTCIPNGNVLQSFDGCSTIVLRT